MRKNTWTRSNATCKETVHAMPAEKAVPTCGTAFTHGREPNYHYNAAPKALAFTSNVGSLAISFSSLAAPCRAPAKMAPV